LRAKFDIYVFIANNWNLYVYLKHVYWVLSTVRAIRYDILGTKKSTVVAHESPI